MAFADAERILTVAWSRAGGDLAERAEREVANTLKTTERAMVEGRATGVPSLEEITPGLYAELEEIFGWKARATVGGHERNGYGDAPTALVPWPKLAEEADHGLAGEIVGSIAPHTEANPVAVLANLLCAFGNAMGRGAYFRVGADEHH